MDRIVEVDFAGGLKVNARMGAAVIPTDQPVESGGEGTAPSPLSLFLASLATCAGYYALQFCLSRYIATEGLACRAVFSYNETERRYTRVRIDLTLPQGFPDNYRNAIIKAVDSCAVRKHLVNPPSFEVTAG